MIRPLIEILKALPTEIWTALVRAWQAPARAVAAEESRRQSDSLRAIMAGIPEARPFDNDWILSAADRALGLEQARAEFYSRPMSKFYAWSGSLPALTRLAHDPHSIARDYVLGFMSEPGMGASVHVSQCGPLPEHRINDKKVATFLVPDVLAAIEVQP